jgi:hypothetical protein
MASDWQVYKIKSRDDVNKIEQQPGVYVIYYVAMPIVPDYSCYLIYVGQSIKVRSRVKNHCKPINYVGKELLYLTQLDILAERLIVKVRYSRKLGEELMRERRLITRLQPAGNKGPWSVDDGMWREWLEDIVGIRRYYVGSCPHGIYPLHKEEKIFSEQ